MRTNKMETGTMQMPPLRLEDNFFTNLQVTARPPAMLKKMSADLPRSAEVDCRIGVLPHEEAPTLYEVTLWVKNAEDDETRAYDIAATVVGVFRFAEEYPVERRRGFVEMVGPTMLWGSLREILAILTARGPYGPVNLPTVSFIQQKGTGPKGAAAQTAEATKPESTPPSAAEREGK